MDTESRKANRLVVRWNYAQIVENYHAINQLKRQIP